MRAAGLRLEGTRVVEAWGPTGAPEAERRRALLPECQARVDRATSLVGRARAALQRAVAELVPALRRRRPPPCAAHRAPPRRRADASAPPIRWRHENPRHDRLRRHARARLRHAQRRGLPGPQGRGDRRALALGVDHRRGATDTVIVSKRAMPTDKLPDFVKSFVGKELHLTETSDWGPAAADGSRQGRLTVTVGGAPITLDATLSLAPSGQGSRELVEGDLTAKVPAARRQDRAGRRARDRGGHPRRAQHRRHLAGRLTHAPPGRRTAGTATARRTGRSMLTRRSSAPLGAAPRHAPLLARSMLTRRSSAHL